MQLTIIDCCKKDIGDDRFVENLEKKKKKDQVTFECSPAHEIENEVILRPRGK